MPSNQVNGPRRGERVGRNLKRERWATITRCIVTGTCSQCRDASSKLPSPNPQPTRSFSQKGLQKEEYMLGSLYLIQPEENATKQEQTTAIRWKDQSPDETVRAENESECGTMK
jgi:hypothetical protein